MATIAELRSEPPLPAASPLPPSTPVRPILDLSQIVSEPVPDQSPMMTATPPSRNGNGLPGTDYARKRVTLSREEAQIAAIAGISVQEYAANKLKLEREKARAITDKSTWLECPSTLASSNGFTAGVTLDYLKAGGTAVQVVVNTTRAGLTYNVEYSLDALSSGGFSLITTWSAPVQVLSAPMPS